MRNPRKKKDQIHLRKLMRDLGFGQAESEGFDSFQKRFHPIGEHVRAFDPDVVLIVGERGTGKSALFRAVFENNLLEAIARHAQTPRLPSSDPESVSWLQAHPLQAGFPDALSLRRCLAVGAEEKALCLWFAYLVRALRTQLEGEGSRKLEELFELPGGGPRDILDAFEKAGDEPLLALDRLDQKLQSEDRWIFVGYDELDTLGGYDWEAMRRALQGLIGFWAGYSRRWRRLRAKLFLRTDLFRRHADFGGADLAKLAANRVELAWNDPNLLAMLTKRLANTHEDLLHYCEGSKIDFRADPDLGQIPQIQEDRDVRPFIERMMGEFMGAGAKKGRTFTWILDHLRDAHGRVAPRNLVRLIEQAATKDAVNKKVRAPRLLHPTALRQALEDVSADHVRQAISHEWPWLHGIRQRVEGSLMPIKKGEFRDLLVSDWEKSWGAPPDLRPPVESPADLVDYLLELGILRERTQERIDVPDIYLFGLGLKRKGGVSTRG